MYSRLIKGLSAIAVALLPALAPAQQPSGSASEAGLPDMDLELLDRIQPGWNIVASEGSSASGSVQLERKVWPMFYLHWWPWEESMGRVPSVEAAAERVAGIWEELTIDSPLEGREIALPQHPAILFETTISNGEWRTRYVAWYCPESFRVFIADANLSLSIAAPEVLLDWQIDIVRTVLCHTTATVARHDLLTRRQTIPRSELSLHLPEEWEPVGGYRVQPSFGGMNFKSPMPRNTALRGQTLILANDALRQFNVFWSEEEDFPMSYDHLQLKIEDFWRSRAKELMPLGNSVLGGFWRMDGLVLYTPEGIPFLIPAARFRGWLWRIDDVTYFAMGSITPSRFGRKDPVYDWDDSFERMLKAFNF